MPRSRWLVFAILLNVGSLALSGVGFYTSVRHSPNGFAVAWGVTPAPHRCYATVNTTELTQYQDGFDMCLICRPQDVTVDAARDTRIAKSELFAIDGSTKSIMTVVFPDTLMGRSDVDIYLAVIPKSIRPEQVSRLEDVKILGGHVLFVGGVRPSP